MDLFQPCKADANETQPQTYTKKTSQKLFHVVATFLNSKKRCKYRPTVHNLRPYLRMRPSITKSTAVHM